MLLKVSSFVRSTKPILKYTPFLQQRFYAKQEKKKDAKTAAVILTGCGYLDGAEITEAVSTIIHLSRRGYKVTFFAPEGNQPDVINHLTKKKENDTRNIIQEAMRITRVPIQPLKNLKVSAFETLFVPGGFGAAKTLCDFAFKGSEYTVDPLVASFIKEFHEEKKAMGFCCIAPMIVAQVLGKNSGGPGVKVTVGAEGDASKIIELQGSTHEVKEVDDVCVDYENRVVTTPAFMYGDAPFYKIFEGIGKMVDTVAAFSGNLTDAAKVEAAKKMAENLSSVYSQILDEEKDKL